MYLKIGQFANRIGVTPATVRNWDKEGILKPHHISPTGYRYYSQAQVDEYLSKKKDNDD